MNISRKYISLVIMGFVFLLTISSLFSQKYYLTISFIMLGLTILPFFIVFERKEIRAEEMVLISVLSALASIGRVPFAAIPSVQPTSFIIIMTGLSFGGNTGFIVGSMSALISNMILGQGPWTPWQMFAWGMMGFTASLFRERKFMKSPLAISIFGAVWGFLFGWIMNLWGALYLDPSAVSWKVYLASCIASFKFDLSHAISNVIFISLFTNRWRKILDRVKIKYGLMS